MTSDKFGPGQDEERIDAPALDHLDPDAPPFGACPECGSSDKYLNIYKQHFFYCEEHRLTWSPGYNLMSSWRYQDPAEWRAAWEQLKGYRTVDGFGQYEPGAPLGEQTTLEALLPDWAKGETEGRSAEVLAFPAAGPSDADPFDTPPANPANPHRFGEEPYPGEVRDLMNELDGRRQEAAQAFGEEHPFSRLLDSALRSADVEELRTARAAVYGMGLIW